MAKRIHVGMMMITERPIGVEPLKSRVMGNYELLLMDGREISRKDYPRLSQLLKRGGFGNKLPSEQQELDIQDHYVVARRLSKAEMLIVNQVRDQNGGAN